MVVVGRKNFRYKLGAMITRLKARPPYHQSWWLLSFKLPHYQSKQLCHHDVETSMNHLLVVSWQLGQTIIDVDLNSRITIRAWIWSFCFKVEQTGGSKFKWIATTTTTTTLPWRGVRLMAGARLFTSTHNPEWKNIHTLKWREREFFPEHLCKQ